MRKRLGLRSRTVGLLTISAAAVAAIFVFAGPSAATTVQTLDWNGQNGATACAGTTTGTILWIFNPHSAAVPVSLDTTWAGTGFTGTQTDTDWQQMGSGSWHLTIDIPAGDTFADLTGATLSYTGDLGNNPILTISGCNEGGGPPPAAAPTISKTASQNTHFDWGITKAVDKTEIDVTPGASATFHYTVTLTGTGTTGDVTGTITVFNNAGGDINLATLTDQLSDGTICTVDTSLNTSLTIPASGSYDFPYSCGLSAPPTDAPNTTNTATMTWDAQLLSSGEQLAAGTDFATVPVDFTVDDNCATATDTFNGGTADALGTYCADTGSADTTGVTLDNFLESYTAPTWTLTYSRTVPAPTTLGTCQEYDNRAAFADNSTPQTFGHADASATVCAFNAPLTIGYWKTHMYLCPAHTKTGTNGCNNNGPFTVQYLPQTLGSYTVSAANNGAAALAIFNANNCSNASGSSQNAVGCLAAQLLAAKLNIAHGSNPACISATIAAADAFLTSIGYAGPTVSYSLTSAQRATAVSLANSLNNYNNNGC
jgi:hypothetical protein